MDIYLDQCNKKIKLLFFILIFVALFLSIFQNKIIHFFSRKPRQLCGELNSHHLYVSVGYGTKQLLYLLIKIS